MTFGFKLPILLLLTCWAGMLLSAVQEIRVLARVANQSISSRDLQVFSVLIEPSSFRPNAPFESLAQETEDALLQELILQILVSEENKIIGVASVSEQDVSAELKKLQARLGRYKWDSFLNAYDLTESAVRDRLRQVLVVEATLKLQLEDAMNQVSGNDAAAAERSLRNWIQRLRSRYKVIRLKEPQLRQKVQIETKTTSVEGADVEP